MIMRIGNGIFFLMVLLCCGMSAYAQTPHRSPPPVKPVEYYSWTWDWHEFERPTMEDVRQINEEYPNWTQSEELCDQILGTFPGMARYIMSEKAAKGCMAPAVKYFLSWIPDYKPMTLPKEVVPTLETEIETPGRVINAFDNAITRMIGNAKGDFKKLHKYKDYILKDRISYIVSLKRVLEEGGEKDLAEAVARGEESRIPEGLYHPLKTFEIEGKEEAPNTSSGFPIHSTYLVFIVLGTLLGVFAGVIFIGYRMSRRAL